MKPYKEMTREELMQEKAALEARYKEFQDKGMKLDMSRGKPSKAQLDLSNGMMDVLNSGSDMMCGRRRLQKLWHYGWYSGGKTSARRHV